MSANDSSGDSLPSGTPRTQASTTVGSRFAPFSATPPRIPDHELIKCIGHGSFGDVWLARTIMGAYRAIKIVYRHAFDHPRPYEREFEGIRRFEPVSRRHESQLAVLQVGRSETDEYFYYVMELADDAGGEVADQVAGEGAAALESGGSPTVRPESYHPKTLKLELRRRGRMPVDECLRIGLSLATALQHLHDQGLIHRDIKPSNIIFVGGLPKLADIGLISTVDATMSVSGTPGYIAPEGSGTPQADVYSLGKVLYEMSMGRDRAEFPRLPEDFGSLPQRQRLLELNAVIVKAGYGDPGQRYSTAAELHADLALVRSGRSVKLWHRMERHLARIRRVAAGLALVLAVVVLAWWKTNQAENLANRSLVRRQVDEGVRHLREGDNLAALPWLMEGLRLEPAGEERREIHRRRIASVLESCPRLARVFSVPEAKLLDADISPGGDRVATAHEDGGVRLWNGDSGELAGEELSHDAPVHFCRFLSGSDRLLTSTFRREALVWDLGPDAPTSSVLAHYNLPARGRWYDLSVNYEKHRVSLVLDTFALARTNRLPVGGKNLALRLTVTGEAESTRIRYAVLSRSPEDGSDFEGEFVDTPGFDDLEQGRELDPTPIRGPVWLALVSLGVGSDGDLERAPRVVWDNVRLRSYSSREPPPSDWRRQDGFSGELSNDWMPFYYEQEYGTENGRLVQDVTSGFSGLVWLVPLEIRDGQTIEAEVDLVEATEGVHTAELMLMQPPSRHEEGSWDPVLSQDGRWLAVAPEPSVLQIQDLATDKFLSIDTEQGEEPLRLRHGDQVAAVGFSHDGRLLVTVTLTKGQAVVWNLENGEGLALELPVGFRSLGARFSPEGTWLAVHSHDRIALARVGDWRRFETLPVEGELDRIAFSPVGHRLAFLRNGRTLCLVDLSDFAAPRIEIEHDFDIEHFEFAPDGDYVATETPGDGLVQVWRVANGRRVLSPLRGELGRFSSAGEGLLLLRPDRGAWLWDLSTVTRRVLHVPPAVSQEPRAFSPDGALTAVVTGSEVAVERPGSVHRLLTHSVPVKRAWFSPGSDYVVTETRDQRSWIWELETGALMAPPAETRYDVGMDAFPAVRLPADTRSEATLADISVLLSGQRPDGKGGMESIAVQTIQSLCHRLEPFYYADTGGPAEVRGSWHFWRAEQSEQEAEWEAAAFHWRCFQQLSPQAAQGADRFAYAQFAARQLHEHISAGRVRASFRPPRLPWATTNMLDLSSCYTKSLRQSVEPTALDNSFGRLSSGVQCLAGVGFDVRGIVELREGETVRVPIGLCCRRIHFLHAAKPGPGFATWVGAVYELKYASGGTEKVDVWSPADLVPYRTAPFLRSYASVDAWSSPGLTSSLAWAGTNPDVASRHETLFLSRTTWELPTARHTQIVSALEMRRGSNSHDPLVFAVTVE